MVNNTISIVIKYTIIYIIYYHPVERGGGVYLLNKWIILLNMNK